MSNLVENIDEKSRSNESEENKSTLSFFAKVGYGFGHVFNDLCATVWFSYMLLFLKDVLGMPGEAGSFMMLGQIADAIFSAIVGLMTDRYSTKRNWHILGTVIVALSFPMMFMLQRDALPYWANLFYFSVFITIFQCGWAVVQISHLAILPELSTTHNDRSELNSMRYCMSIFSNITVFMVAWMVLHIRNRSADRIEASDFDKFRSIAILLTALGLVTTIIFIASLNISNYNRRRQDKAAIDSSNKSSKLRILNVLGNIELYKIAFLYAFSRLFLIICIIYIPIWLNEFMKTKSDQSIENIAIIPLIFFVASFLAAFLLKYINQNISHKIIYCAGSLVSISGCLWIALSTSFNVNELFGIAIMLGAGSSITQISSLCITADMIGDKAEHGGLIYSMITVCDKLFSGIIIFVISQMESFGTSHNYYTDVLIFNGITALLGLMVLLTFKSKVEKL